MLTTIVAGVALVVGIAALALGVIVMRQGGETTTDLRMHRRAHTIAHGHADPKLDRRQVALGPPRSTGERRGRQYEPPRDRLAPRPLDVPTGELEQPDLPTSMLEQQPGPPRRAAERPGPLGGAPDPRRQP